MDYRWKVYTINNLKDIEISKLVDTINMIDNQHTGAVNEFGEVIHATQFFSKILSEIKEKQQKNKRS